MYSTTNFIQIIEDAWHEYDSSREIKSVEDISAKVSTNHVYKIRFEEEDSIIAKLSYFGHYEDFVSDHSIVNALANNLHSPFQNFLSKSLTKDGHLFVHRHQDSLLDAWVVFYSQIDFDQKPAKRQSEDQIRLLGQELARFHKACLKVRNTLPTKYKQIGDDISHLKTLLKTDRGQYEHRGYIHSILNQCDMLEENMDKIGVSDIPSIPVFVDWNIGNFSVTKDYRFFSRWDYDWFRMSSRVMDFYFFSRVCSDIGDKTIFSYHIDPMLEDRFIIFLKAYHEIYPLTEKEILFMKESYRFFVLNYVIKDGRYFFHELYAFRLQQEAHEIYFNRLDNVFSAEKFLKALNI